MPNIFSGSFLPLVHTRATLPAASTMTGVSVYLSDTNELAWSNGSNWVFSLSRAILTATGVVTFDGTTANTTVLVTLSSPLSMTLPATGTPGYTVDLVQAGTNAFTLIAAGGAPALMAAGGATSAGQYAVVRATCVANSNGSSAQWLVTGDTI